jgi:hypothetical protein
VREEAAVLLLPKALLILFSKYAIIPIEVTNVLRNKNTIE